MRLTVLLLLILAVAYSCKNVKKESPSEKVPLTLSEMVAFAHGIEYWDQVEELGFTFNVDRGENHFERSWIWKPKTKDITRILGEDTLKYNQSSMDSIALKADATFINDKY